MYANWWPNKLEPIDRLSKTCNIWWRSHPVTDTWKWQYLVALSSERLMQKKTKRKTFVDLTMFSLGACFLSILFVLPTVSFRFCAWDDKDNDAEVFIKKRAGKRVVRTTIELRREMALGLGSFGLSTKPREIIVWRVRTTIECATSLIVDRGYKRTATSRRMKEKLRFQWHHINSVFRFNLKPAANKCELQLPIKLLAYLLWFERSVQFNSVAMSRSGDDMLESICIMYPRADTFGYPLSSTPSS